MVVLGSGSPRRREILTLLGVPHVVIAASADETVRPGERADQYLPRVVAAKREAVRAIVPPEHAGRPILVADTSVVLGDDILGKPESEAEALEMILRLAGRAHEVHTRFALDVHEETVVTRVVFRAVTEAEARAYAVTGEGRDKAGGYAAQGRAMAFVQRIEGSYTNVVGLPACEVSVALARLKIP
jgi:septum formation protein